MNRSRNYTLIFLILFLLAWPVFSEAQQISSGFYIVIPKSKNCSNKLRTFDDSKGFCLPTEPIISESDFENVSDIKYDSIRRFRYLILTLSVEGFKTLKLLTEKMPEVDLALVVDGKVAGIFDNPDRIVSREVPVQAGNNLAEIFWIHSKLKKPGKLFKPLTK